MCVRVYLSICFLCTLECLGAFDICLPNILYTQICLPIDRIKQMRQPQPVIKARNLLFHLHELSARRHNVKCHDLPERPTHHRHEMTHVAQHLTQDLRTLVHDLLLFLVDILIKVFVLFAVESFVGAGNSIYVSIIVGTQKIVGAFQVCREICICVVQVVYFKIVTSLKSNKVFVWL